MYKENNHQKHSVLSFMYCIVLSMKLFSIEEWLWCSMFRNLHACGYQVPLSVEILCFPYLLISDFINCSATSILLSIERGECLESSYSLAQSQPITIHITTCFNQCLINYEFRYCPSSLKYPLWFISLNPIPDRDMISFDTYGS